MTGYPAVMQEEDFAALAAPDERRIPGILFWRVPEPKKPAKSRTSGFCAQKDPMREIDRLIGLGAQGGGAREREWSKLDRDA